MERGELTQAELTWELGCGRGWCAGGGTLDEARAQHTTFLRFPVAQWKSLRSTNAIERVFGEFRRQLKVQGRCALRRRR